MAYAIFDTPAIPGIKELAQASNERALPPRPGQAPGPPETAQRSTTPTADRQPLRSLAIYTNVTAEAVGAALAKQDLARRHH
ncbi:hypothetical protein GCM10010191_77190 [Actinomadura vinacea]|uniref:Uncharacterized protein n=1 Tax=Actinomadura vinacea TaxID=115336 RepID=A0ABN3K3E1_9ACTN